MIVVGLVVFVVDGLATGFDGIALIGLGLAIFGWSRKVAPRPEEQA